MRMPTATATAHQRHAVRRAADGECVCELRAHVFLCRSLRNRKLSQGLSAGPVVREPCSALPMRGRSGPQTVAAATSLRRLRPVSGSDSLLWRRCEGVTLYLPFCTRRKRGPQLTTSAFADRSVRARLRAVAPSSPSPTRGRDGPPPPAGSSVGPDPFGHRVAPSVTVPEPGLAAM